MTCTWKDPKEAAPCGGDAVRELRDDKGAPWSNLCQAHAERYDSAFVEPIDAKLVACYWVRAAGGAKALAERMQPSLEPIARAYEALRRRRSR